MKITMQTVADRLGVSKNTVSQALRNKNTVSSQTKDAVFQMADKLGYQYQKETKSEATTGNRFAIIASEYTLSFNSFFGIILNKIKELIVDQKQTIDVFMISKEDETQGKLPEKLNADNYDGLFILSFFSDQYLDLLNSVTDLPKILIDHHRPGLEIDSVLSANIDGAYEAMSYLATKGVKTVGFIGEIDRSPSYAERMIGFENALSSLHLETTDQWTINHLPENQNSLFETIAAVKKQPDAWFCVNNGYAFSLMNYFQSHQMNVPQDIKVLAFDDTDLSRMTQPRMTVMATDLNEMGKSSYDLLQYRMTHPDSVLRQVCLKPNLIIGGTV
ncbi:LacI family DNA-binding transcriptional regulator [Lapidilactobacillus mulanensis]|uniref:LacI family DNA-binding transcriptional regulator n=1 Tax=Lapidilactobacillus mulanensis TaxID=2485999 RepID=A0ABW4DQA3_9LACO|nr:LacI family DNA-binding transcriptional regulator [Lapidilactobacillus mulanensis]